MSDQEDLRPALKETADAILGRLSPAERQALLVKCWMSHDARWFMAVAREYGMQVTNRLNQIAAHEVGKAEARRIVQALRLPPVRSIDEYARVQEVFIGLLGPDLLDYAVTRVSDDACQVQVRRCFAHDNATRAGVAAELECGIFARVTGWLEALGLEYQLTPALGPCLKASGQDCRHTITLAAGRDSG